MQKKAIGTLLGGLFNHLVNSLTCHKDNVWEKNQFGGAVSPFRSYPYVIFGKQESRAWRSVTFDGEHHRIERVNQNEVVEENEGVNPGEE